MVIRFGKLREKVKKGKFSPKEVLEWALKQKNVSPSFLNWLFRRNEEKQK